MDHSLTRYLRVGVGYTAKGNMPGAENQFQEIRESAAEKQVETGDEYWREVESACSEVLEKIEGRGEDPDFPEMGKEVKKILEDRLDMELPEIKEKHLEKGRLRSERKERQERMQNRDVKEMIGKRSPPSSLTGSSDEEDTGISYSDGVGEGEKTVDSDSTEEVLQDRVEFLEDEVRKSQEDLIELKRELDEAREGEDDEE
jgi:hypothetical protein